MNKVKVKEFIVESVELELNVADVYKLFSDVFPEDRDFWKQLSLEEKNHAALLKSMLFYAGRGIIREDRISEDLKTVKAINNEVKKLLKLYSLRSPSADEAFHLALTLEKTAVEMQCQYMLGGEPGSKPDKVIKKLNQGCNKHIVRIQNHQKKKLAGCL